MNSLLEMRGITKAFAGVVANDNVGLEVSEGEIHALLGENGAGKTTLTNILYGLYRCDSGEIYFKGAQVHIHSPQDAIALGIGMVHQEFMLVPTFTVAENIALGLNLTNSPLLELDQVDRGIRDLSARHGLGVDPRAKIEHLSVGVQQRVEILKLLYRKARLLILDEPTAVLTPQETDGLFEVLRSLVAEGQSVILITHKLNEVMAISDRVTILRDGKVVATRTTKGTNQYELAEMMVGREVLFEVRKESLAPADTLLEVENLHVSDDTGLPALKGVSFQIRACEILGVAGVDGNGQRELMEALAGLRVATRGTISVAGLDVTGLPPLRRYSRGLAYVPADRRGVGCIESLSVAQNSILGRCREFTVAGGLVLSRARVRRHASELVASFDVRCPGVDVAASKLSGGNLQKLMLGRELTRRPKVLVVEQPTRGLDVAATEYVRNTILEARRSGAAVLLVSSEMDEILALSDRILVIYEGRIMATLQNDQHLDVRMIGLMMAGGGCDVAAQAGESAFTSANPGLDRR